jgi:hypothetical protein
MNYDLYGPVRNAFDEGIIHYLGKWEAVKWHRADRRVPFGAQNSRCLKLNCYFYVQGM